MSNLKIFKETALPGVLEANAVYLIAPVGYPNYVEMYVTGTSASTVKRVINADDIQAMINTSLAGFNDIQIVANIAARNALAIDRNFMVLVTDATGDVTVTSGSAMYAYNNNTDTYVKVAEYESLDVAITWSALTGKPTSAVVDIDDAVTKRHTHANLTQLNKVGEDGNGNFTYNGSVPYGAWASNGW